MTWASSENGPSFSKQTKQGISPFVPHEKLRLDFQAGQDLGVVGFDVDPVFFKVGAAVLGLSGLRKVPFIQALSCFSRLSGLKVH